MASRTFCLSTTTDRIGPFWRIAPLAANLIGNSWGRAKGEVELREDISAQPPTDFSVALDGRDLEDARRILAGIVRAGERRSILNGGEAVLNFSVCANEKWKDKNGNKQERAEWFNCALWGKRAEVLAQYLTKGSRVLVEGRLRTDKYEKDGETRYATKVVVLDIVLLGGGDESSHDRAPARNPGRAPQTSRGGYGGANESEGNQGYDDDIPF